MYYKIENTASEVYVKLHALRTKELRIEKENKLAIIAKFGSDFGQFFGIDGQQQFRRVTQYKGFAFTNPENLELKDWVTHKENSSIYLPNRRTAKGREIAQFLFNGLEQSWYLDVIEILALKNLNHFIFPFVVIAGDVILIFLDDKHEPSDKNVIEITKREFNEIYHKTEVA